MLSEFYMLFSVLGIIIAFIVLGLVIYILEGRKRRRFIEKAMLFHNVSHENSETLYRLHNDQKIASTNSVYTRGVRLNGGSRVDSLQRENFYCLTRWTKQLKNTKNDHELRLTVLQVIREMNERASSYGIDPFEQMRLRNLIDSTPEEILVHYS